MLSGTPKQNLNSADDFGVPGANSEMSERIKYAISQAGGDQIVHARSGVKIRSLQNYKKKGGATPGADTASLIAEATGFALEWLVTGDGPIRRQSGSSAGLHEAPAVYDQESLPDGFVLLPKYEVRAAAGDGALVHSEQIVDHLAFKHDWIVRQLRRNPVYLILIEAMGDSMVPTIGDRDLLLVDTSDAQLRDNAIYALSLNGDVVVKRLERRMSGAVRVISDNRDNYDPYELGPDEADELRIIGQVVWHGGKL